MLGLPTEGIEDIISLSEHIARISPNGLYIIRYENDPELPLAKLPQIPENIYFYHLKLLLSLLKKNNINNKIFINCEALPQKTRIYNKNKKLLASDIEIRERNGFDTAYHLRRELTLYPKKKKN